MCPGIAKIPQHSIAEVLGQIAVKLAHHLGTGLLIGTYHLPEVCWVQVPSQGRRVHQAAGQHREVAAFDLRWQGVWKRSTARTRWYWPCGTRHHAGVLLDWHEKAIAPPRHRGNEAGCPRRVVQHLAQGADGDAEHSIRHGSLRPHGVEEFVFGDQTVRVRHQVVQHRKDFGRQGNGLCPVPQAGIVRVETEAVKAPLRRGHRFIPLGSAELSRWTARDGMYHGATLCTSWALAPCGSLYAGQQVPLTAGWHGEDSRVGGSLWRYGTKASLALMPHLGIAEKRSYPMASQVPRGQGILDTSYHSRRTEAWPG